MAEAAIREATYADPEAVPAHLVAEIIDGRLETQSSLPPRHGAAATALMGELGPAFGRPQGRPGNWMFCWRPEFHFGSQVVVPDMAGWQNGRMLAELDAAFIETPPDWVCEVLSPPTARLDRGPKHRIYAEAGVGHLWLLDPADGVLEAFAPTDGQWLLLGTVQRGEAVSLPPFDAVSFPLDDLFAFDDPAAPNSPET
ncbi:Uma2 family endonuclease [Methylobacterium iners]|uniref:Putative restriction endonuclease domain-containing protein n=1 Tax=Methylobacterium iners TaxID=418707 RepID=A0ABQ4S106_9HYPH|nr:Uma2 family endonuclease [Methylobacterium iners]GJD95415.1 hypothetical protein OCOJLMKI_2627 [Methylobacterium iners]